MDNLKDVGVVKFLAFALVLLLSACGGGGGSSSPVAKVASLSFSSNSNEVSRGNQVTLTWSSQNTTSCSASGDWSGSKSTSGSETVTLESSGTYNYTLNCSGASQSVSVKVTQPFDTSAFISDDQVFSGYLFHKGESSAGCLASVEAELGINDDSSLYFKSFSVTEIRYLSWSDENDGLLFREYFDGYFSYEISTEGHSGTNTININTSTIDPYDNPPESWDDLEQFSGNMSLHFDTSEDNNESCWGADIEMSVMAQPRTSKGSNNDAKFFGTSYGSDYYQFLFLIDQREVDKYGSELPSESDIFNHDWGMAKGFHSYLSTPNLEESEWIKVSSDVPTYDTNNFHTLNKTIAGARLTDSLYSNGSTKDYSAYAVKYLYNEGVNSNQRMFLKVDISEGCYENTYYTCSISNYEILFFAPDAVSIFGFGLGGYNNNEETTYVKWGIKATTTE